MAASAASTPLSGPAAGLLHRVAGEDPEPDRHPRLDRERGERRGHRVAQHLVMAGLAADDRGERNHGVGLARVDDGADAGGDLERSGHAGDRDVFGPGAPAAEGVERGGEHGVGHGRIPPGAHDGEPQPRGVEASLVLLRRERHRHAARNAHAQRTALVERSNCNPARPLRRTGVRARGCRRSCAGSARRTPTGRNGAAAARVPRARRPR